MITYQSTRYKIGLLILLTIFAAPVWSQTVTLTIPAATVVPGQVVTATAHVANRYAPVDVVLTAQAQVADWAGNNVISFAPPLTLHVIHPLMWRGITLPIGAQLTYVAGSAAWKSLQIGGTVNNGVLSLTFAPPLGLADGESADVVFGLKVAGSIVMPQ